MLFLDMAIFCRLTTQPRDWSRMPGVLHQSRDWLQTVSYNMSSATLSPSPTQLYSIHTTDCLSDTFQRESRRAIGTSSRTSLLLLLHHAECFTQSLPVNVSHMMPVMYSSLWQQVPALENQVLGVGLVFMSCSTVISHYWTSYHIHLLNSHGTVNSRTCSASNRFRQLAAKA